jgi:hypothetical protein
MQSVPILNLAKEATMSLSRIRLGCVLAVVVVLAAALVSVAGAGTSRVEQKNPWYAYDAALRKAAQHPQTVRASSRRVPGTRTTPLSGRRATSASSSAPDSTHHRHARRKRRRPVTNQPN